VIVLSLKILVLSDIHNQTVTLNSILKEVQKSPNPPKTCLIAGDITNFGSYEDLNSILNIISQKFRDTYFILGNCDPFFDFEEISMDAMYVESTPHKIDFFTIIGFGNHDPKINHKLLKKLEKAGEKLCLLSHTPPFGTKADMVSFDRHAGSRTLREAIEKYQNIFLIISGHIHDSPVVSMSDRYTVINPGPVTRGYYALIDINEDFSVDGQIHNIHEKR
jgi:Icc-related predicted phosphoesterase